MDKLILIELSKLEPDPDQPRKDFDEERLDELASSIAAVGVKTPISVRRHPVKDGFYMIIAGERRYRACEKIGLKKIPGVLVQDESSLSADAIYAHQLTENLHRQDLNPVEKAEFIQARIDYLKNRRGVSNAKEMVAKELGVSPSWISKNIAILRFVPELRSVAREGLIREYALLNKINNMTGPKRKEVLALIENGDFNAKEYFSRKRYEKKDGKKVDADAEAETQPPAYSVYLKFPQSAAIKLVDKTDYGSVLDKHDPEWRSSDGPVLKSYMRKFREWLVDGPQ